MCIRDRRWPYRPRVSGGLPPVTGPSCGHPGVRQEVVRTAPRTRYPTQAPRLFPLRVRSAGLLVALRVLLPAEVLAQPADRGEVERRSLVVGREPLDLRLREDGSHLAERHARDVIGRDHHITASPGPVSYTHLRAHET